MQSNVVVSGFCSSSTQAPGPAQLSLPGPQAQIQHQAPAQPLSHTPYSQLSLTSSPSSTTAALEAVRCPSGHQLHLYKIGLSAKASGHSSHQCNSECSRLDIRFPEQIWRCKGCDYDMCEQCASVHIQSRGLGDAAVPDRRQVNPDQGSVGTGEVHGALANSRLDEPFELNDCVQLGIVVEPSTAGMGQLEVGSAVVAGQSQEQRPPWTGGAARDSEVQARGGKTGGMSELEVQLGFTKPSSVPQRKVT